MSDRRTASTSLSARIVEYLKHRGYTQAKIARMLGVSEGFVSLVRSKERSLTLHHLDRLADAMSLPLGALLVAVTEPRKGAKARDKEFFERSAEIIRKCDELRDMLLRATPSRR